MPKIGNRCLQRAALSYILAACFGSALAAPGTTTLPDTLPDPVAKLLLDRGIVVTPSSTAEAGTQPSRTTFASTVRDHASDMVMTAMKFLGVRYVRGGDSEETGFDCSGFTRYIFERSVGLMLPRRADEQANAAGLIAIRRDELKPGDLVFFNTLRRTFSHVGIYIGDGNFIHAPKPGGQVRVENMGLSYWNARFTGARRPEVQAN